MYSVEKRIRYHYRSLLFVQITLFFVTYCLLTEPIGRSEDFPFKFFWVDSTADKAGA